MSSSSSDLASLKDELLRSNNALKVLETLQKISNKGYEVGIGSRGEKNYTEVLRTFETISSAYSSAIEVMSRFPEAMMFIPSLKEMAKYWNKQAEISVHDGVNKCREEGMALRSQGKYEESLNVFDDALSLDSNSADVYVDKGISLFYLGKFEESIDSYKKPCLLMLKMLTLWLV